MSDAFDPKTVREEFDAAGGDDLYTPEELQDGIHKSVENSEGWERAKEISQKAFGRNNWAFINWWANSYGGRK